MADPGCYELAELPVSNGFPAFRIVPGSSTVPFSVYLSLFYYSSAVRWHAAAQELAACRILSDWAESQRIYFGAETAQHVRHCALRLEMNNQDWHVGRMRETE